MRRIKYQLEAKLQGKGRGIFFRPSGKLERKSYENAVERLKIKLRHLRVSDRSIAVVAVDGAQIARINIERGFGKHDVETVNPADLPPMRVGQTVEVHVNGEQVLAGSLYED